MTKIELRGTYQTPKMVFDLKNGVIKILGRSNMVDPGEFYPSIISFIQDYCAIPQQKTRLIIDLEHYNTLSSRYLLKIIDEIVKIEYKEGYEVEVDWYYDEEDEGINEDIQIFSKVLHFNINAIGNIAVC
jgi:hypothetical protein